MAVRTAIGTRGVRRVAELPFQNLQLAGSGDRLAKSIVTIDIDMITVRTLDGLKFIFVL